ncbi:MAG: hypothetical protein LBI99_06380 [Propionibacteriaceae bacterium]|jgi:hypothetical protein|nr:hypothetical protein [Propionibacteriaceae bacterium]
MAVLRPTGSKPVGVYWVRRAIVLLPVVIAIGVLAWAFAPNPADNPPPVGVPSENPSTPLLPTSCNGANIDLDVVGFQKVKASAEKTTFSVSATNTSNQLCQLNISATNTSLVIVSGKDQIWSTADCADWIQTKSGPVEPGGKFEWTLDWPLHRSSPGCKLATAQLKPGTYQAQATWSGASTSKSFQIVK